MLTYLMSFLGHTSDQFDIHSFGVTGASDKPLDEQITEVLKTLDVVGLQGAVTGVLQKLGFGPETETFATGVVILLIVMVVVGYAAGPTSPPPSKDDAANAANAAAAAEAARKKDSSGSGGTQA